ncbi:hypothetical protein [Hymenobacter norwichensis]|uniref:hypothetical protein n=1 Tax=Hymenobacter norwichensis TaxID=223903 RepID=UPI0003B4301B|nr:hypothetical protein [Hymenobacter norwichensis]
MSELIFVLASQDRESLGNVRTLPDVRVAEVSGQLWLRGVPATGELPQEIRSLPAKEVYSLDAQDRLFPRGQRTPTGRLPVLAWQPIHLFVPLELPTAALPAQGVASYRVRLVGSSVAAPGAALRTSLSQWQAYAETAPESRLRGLRFAVSAEQGVVLLGAPLPPIQGQEYWQEQGVLLPAGFAFEAPLLVPLVAQQLNPASDALLVFAADGSWECIPLAQVVPATRSAVRLTAQGFGHA